MSDRTKADESVGAGNRERLVLGSFALGDHEAPSRLLVAPWGVVESANGTFVMDDESARLVLEAFRSHGTDVVIDYEHQSLGGVFASPSGQAPAAGWIRSLRAIAPEDAEGGEAGLFAEVEWTPSARARLATREYRYLSPVVIVRKRDRRVVALHSAALTNKPAIAGMKPIVNAQGGTMLKNELEGGGQEAMLAGDSCTAGSAVDEVVEVLRLRLGLETGAGAEVVLAAASERIESLMGRLAEREAQDQVDLAVRAGKLTAAQREWAMGLVLKDPRAFEDWLASAPTLVKPGMTQAPAGSGEGGHSQRAMVIASARATFRAEPLLQQLTSESSWIHGALREAGLAAE